MTEEITVEHFHGRTYLKWSWAAERQGPTYKMAIGKLEMDPRELMRCTINGIPVSEFEVVDDVVSFTVHPAPGTDPTPEIRAEWIRIGGSQQHVAAGDTVAR